MCGIAGLVGEFIPGLARRMSELQAHRGPDGVGVFEDPAATVALGHRRLAILDLSTAAAQPMISPDGRYVLVYNGEIYNFKELRELLIARGCIFSSTGDTEVLLRGLETFGEAFLERINGMFAFACWDRAERKLLLARDPIGIKPLYYAEPLPGRLLFASEIKAMLAYPGLSREPDFTALYQHLAYSHAGGDRTALKSVRRLAPGALLRWSAADPRPQFARYWVPAFGQPAPRDRDTAVGELRQGIQDATRRQLVSDVPVGVLLSGGLDSSLVTVLAARAIGANLRCYTITYPGSENVLDNFADDTPYARQIARQLGIDLVELEIKSEMASMWPRLIYHLDEPIADPAAIASYLISRTARDHGTEVLLSGQGGDELFGGYVRYQVMSVTNWMAGIPATMQAMLARAAGLMPGSREGSIGAAVRRVRRVLMGLDNNPDKRFLLYCGATPLPEIQRVLSQDYRALIAADEPWDECLEHMASAGLSGMDRFLERDLAIYLPNHNLLYTDKMGMAVGLEARVPLLDLEIVNRVTHYPPEWKVSGSTTKAIFREAARGIVPESIIRRKKTGFGAPYRKWLRYDLKELWDDLTSEATVKRRGWFDPAGLRRARDQSQSGQSDLYMLQWAVLTIELWAQTFIDGNGIPPAAGGSP
jgi:asparagine synthase (glutamine-hydrolysing)